MNPTLRYTFFIIIYFFNLINLSGQQDKFQHQNGLIFEGKVLYFDSKIIRIEKTDGEVVEFPMDVIKILSDQKEYLSLYNRKWTGIFGLKLGFGGDNDSDLSAIGLETGALLRMYGNAESKLIHDLVFKLGLEKYKSSYDALMIPVSIGYRLSGSGKKVVPFAFLNAGGALNITKEDSSIFGNDEDYSGGTRFETGTGVNIKFRDSALDIYLSYIEQQAGYSWSSIWGSYTLDEKFKRIFLNISIQF